MTIKMTSLNRTIKPSSARQKLLTDYRTAVTRYYNGYRGTDEAQRSVGDIFELYLAQWLRDYGLKYKKNSNKYGIDLVREDGKQSIEIKSEYYNPHYMWVQIVKNHPIAQIGGPYLSLSQDITSYTVRYNDVSGKFYIWETHALCQALTKFIPTRYGQIKQTRYNPNTSKVAYQIPIVLICEMVKPVATDFDEFCKYLLKKNRNTIPQALVDKHFRQFYDYLVHKNLIERYSQTPSSSSCTPTSDRKAATADPPAAAK